MTEFIEFFDDAATLDTTFGSNAPGLDAAIEDADANDPFGGPYLADGTYLAVVTGVEPKINTEKGSSGFNWSLTVNLGPVGAGWQGDETRPFTHYTYLGRYVNGKTVPGEKGFGFATINILRALNLRAGNQAQDAIGHILKIVVKNKEGERFPDVKTYAYVDPVTGQVAPLLSAASQSDIPF